MSESDGKGLKYLSIGIGLGAVAGLIAGFLLAPKPGKETRAELAEALKKAENAAKKDFGAIAGKAREAYGKALHAAGKAEEAGEAPSKE